MTKWRKNKTPAPPVPMGLIFAALIAVGLFVGASALIGAGAITPREWPMPAPYSRNVR